MHTRRDFFVVVAEGGAFAGGVQKAERSPAIGEFDEGDTVERFVELSAVEIVDPELVEVAEDDVLGTIGGEADPVVEGLAVVADEVGTAFFHFDQDNGFIDEIGQGGAAVVLLFDAHFERRARFPDAFEIEGLKEAVEEDLGLAFFVSGDVSAHPGDKFGEMLLAVFVHAADEAW